MTELINHLLDRQHLLPNQVIVDCLNLARLNPDPSVRISAVVLAAHFGGVHVTNVSTRMRVLKRRGLIDYEIGYRHHPGYLITRVGPAK